MIAHQLVSGVNDVGRLKHVDVRLCQLQDWVRENTISIGTVKTVLNVADLNTKKLTYARRAFLMYFLSQVEYSEGEEIIHTGVDEYERYEQEKKLKEYVGSGQVKDLIRLIQVFSVIKPVIKPVTAAVWIKDEDLNSQHSGSTDAMEEVKYSRSEVMMLMTLLVLVIPYIWMVMRKVYSEWTRISMIGMVRINSSSKSYIFHRTTCRYVQGKARHGYFIHLEYDTAVAQGYRPCYVCFPEAKKAQKNDEDDEWELTSESTDTTENKGCAKKCTWCKVRKCTRKKPAHVYCSCTECIQKYTEDLWRGQYDQVPEASSSSTQGPTGKKGSGTLEYMPPHVNKKGNRPAGQGSKGGRRGRAAMEPVAEEQNGPMLPEGFTQDTPEVEEQPPTYEDSYDMIVDPGTPDSTEERTMGPPDLYL